MFQSISWPWSSSAPTPVPEKPYDPTDPKQNPLNPGGVKPCCACPLTKRARDDCFMSTDSSEVDEKCKQLVQNHLACMRSLGFKV